MQINGWIHLFQAHYPFSPWKLICGALSAENTHSNLQKAPVWVAPTCLSAHISTQFTHAHTLGLIKLFSFCGTLQGLWTSGGFPSVSHLPLQALHSFSIQLLHTQLLMQTLNKWFKYTHTLCWQFPPLLAQFTLITTLNLRNKCTKIIPCTHVCKPALMYAHKQSMNIQKHRNSLLTSICLWAHTLF